jgi:hypothetical protein
MAITDGNASASGSLYRRALELLELDGDAQWTDSHRCEARIRFRRRAHGVCIYAYEGLTRLVAPIAAVKDLPSGRRSPDGTTSLQEWALDETELLSMGFIDVHKRDGLCFGERLAHGIWRPRAMADLIRTVAERADAYEAALTGRDL